MLIDRIHWLGHSSFRINAANGRVIYIDPFRLSPSAPTADLIFCTHEHADHCSPDDIRLIAGPETVVAGNAAVMAKLALREIMVHPGVRGKARGFAFEAVPAYNLKIPNHVKTLGHTGFIITIDGERLYHAGDTDFIPEMAGLRADVALLPVGGTYTMDASQAALAAESIQAGLFAPMHYGSLVGKPGDGAAFISLCKRPAKLLKKEE